jgi:hypothetical protein
LLAALPPMTNWISDLALLCAYDDSTLPIRQDINHQRTRAGLGPVVFASSNWQRPAADYPAFIDGVWHALGEKRCDAYLPDVRARLMIETKGPSELPLRCKPRSRPRPHPGSVRTKAKASSTKKAWDERLRASYLVYGAVRRHLWQHLLREHQCCVRSAGKHLD